MSSTNKSYNEIVLSCQLVDYKQEYLGKGIVWSEYWVDETHTYKAIFTEAGYPSMLPFTIYKKELT